MDCPNGHKYSADHPVEWCRHCMDMTVELRKLRVALNNLRTAWSEAREAFVQSFRETMETAWRLGKRR